jgi:hypothetical protein
VSCASNHHPERAPLSPGAFPLDERGPQPAVSAESS